MTASETSLRLEARRGLGLITYSNRLLGWLLPNLHLLPQYMYLYPAIGITYSEIVGAWKRSTGRPITQRALTRAGGSLGIGLSLVSAANQGHPVQRASYGTWRWQSSLAMRMRLSPV